MRQLIFLGGLLVMWVGMSSAYALDLGDAKVARQCPGFAAWTKANPCPAAKSDALQRSPSVTQPEWRAELLRMSTGDQKARDTMLASGASKQAVEAARAMADAADGRYPQRLKQMVDTQGFPSVVQVGKDALHAAWLLGPHADRDPIFQARVLNELHPQVGPGGVAPPDFALLTDRVLLAQHKPQCYGAQFFMSNGELKSRPIKDAADVDARRALFRLPPLAALPAALDVSVACQGPTAGSMHGRRERGHLRRTHISTALSVGTGRNGRHAGMVGPCLLNPPTPMSAA